MEKRLSDIRRFLAKTRFEKGCVLWTGSKTRRGYGRFAFEGATQLAHRVAFKLANRTPLLPHHYICHSCDTPLCVNPEHLWLGDVLSNTQDMHRKGRARKAIGSNAAHSKLCAEQVLEMRELFAAGLPVAKLSKQFGVSHAAAGAVVTRKAWKHV